MKLTIPEVQLLTQVIMRGHTIREIEQSATEFRVSFMYAGHRATGSNAIIYNLRASIKGLQARIIKGEHRLRECAQ